MLDKKLQNTLWLYIQYLLKLVILIVLNIVIARQFGAINFGIFNYIFSFFSLFLVFINFGIDEFVIKELIFRSNDFNTILGTVFVIRLIGSFFSIFLISIILVFINDNQGVSFYFLLYMPVFFLNLFNILDLFYRSRNLAKLTSYASISAQIIAVTLYIIIFTLNYKFINVFYVLIIEGLIYILSLIFIYIKIFGNIFEWKFSSDYFFEIIKKSWPLFFTAIFVSIISRIDQILIKHFIDFKNVGLYSVAVRISEGWFFFMIIYSNINFPNYLNSKKNNYSYDGILKKMFIENFIICIFFIAIILLFSRIIILKIYGVEFLDSIKIIKLYVFSSIPISFGLIWSKWIISENKQLILVYSNILTLILNILLNIKFIPLYGIFGATIVNVFSYFIGQLFGITLYKKKYLLTLLFKNKSYVKL